MRLENLDDGSKLEAAWHEALEGSLSYFRALLQSSNSSAWKPVQVLPLTSSTVAHDAPSPSTSQRKLGSISATDVKVFRRSGRGGEVFRAVAEVDCGPDVGIEDFRGCLVTPETRPMWDRMVEEAMTEDLLDAHTRVTRTRFRLGWPSSPRDAITISKTLIDQRTLVDISTSLPRSRHEPAYLRPAPPYVRAHVTLLAWFIQLPGSATDLSPGKCRITCFWSWNPKGAWAVGGGVPQHLPSLMVGLVNQVRDGSEKVPVLLDYGPEVSFGNVSYDPVRVTLGVGYAIVAGGHSGDGHVPRRQVEFGISSTESWDIQIHVKTQHGEESPSTSWTSFVGQSPPVSYGALPPKRLIVRFCHAPLTDYEELVRVKVSIERTSSSASGVRINGIPVTIEPMSTHVDKRPLLEETASTSGISLRTMSTMEPMSINKMSSERRRSVDRSQAAGKGIAALIKRNYIYFTSLLQEPEPKWRSVLDSRGVAIHQLNSIDKTLVVFRAEAVFVGVGIWDLYATIASPGARLVWDKTHDDASLLEDVNELTDLWHMKTKAAWPVSARDSVMLRTTYKSPSSVHLFGFSVDDAELFKTIPPIIDPTVIRTQIDLQGWSIESLSPNTTQVTLVEQSDPRGWSNKSSIPQVMMTTLAGIGEFSIKHGAPPVATRLGGAKALSSRYDVEKETFRYEYQSAEARRSNSSSTATAFPLPVAVRNPEVVGSENSSLRSLEARRLLTTIDCEIRCDADKWASTFVVVVDPPQYSISALRRHRLSTAGGGLWLTIEHDPATLGDEKVVVTVKRGLSPPGAKTLVTCNGHKVKIDYEEMTETDAHLLKKQRRSRPTRAPLDQPPALGTLRKRQSTMDMSIAAPSEPAVAPAPITTYSRLSMPLARWYSVAAESTRAAIIPMATPSPALVAGSTPIDAAVRSLAQLARIHADRDGESTDPFGWQPVSERDGLKIEKKLVPHVSESFPVYRAGRIIEGFTAEEVSAAVSSLRKDECYDKSLRLESYGHGISTSQATAYTAFPFRSRSMLVATVVARAPDGPPLTPSIHPSTSLSTIFHASTSSFDASAIGFDSAKYNPLILPNGNIVLEGWILETIDPYSHEQYAIPSTRCMFVGATDYSGNIPLSVNNVLNTSLPRSILAVESILKTKGPPCRAQTPNMSIMMPDTSTAGPWALEGSDADKAGVDERIEEDGYSLTVSVSPSSSGDKRDGGLMPILRHNESKTSVNSTRSTIIDLGEDIRRGRKDLVVCEVYIGHGMVKAGAEISVRGIALPVALHSSRTSESIMPFSLPPQQLDLPFNISVIALAPSVLQSASLDPSAVARHLLRITLPTSEFEAPITDPLTGKSAPAPRPRWYLDLLNDGAVVQLRLKTRKQGGEAKYMMGDSTITVEDERKIRTFKGVESKLSQLVNRDTPGSKSLERPLAVATELMSETPPRALDAISEDNVTISSPDPNVEPLEERLEVSEIVPPPHDTLAPPSRYNFWKYKYPYPRLNRFSISAPSTAPPSPINPIISLVPGDEAKSSLTSQDGVGTAIVTTTPAAIHALLTPQGLIICCLLSLLLGSLFRSLLSEADYIVYLPPGAEHPNGGEWRELKRLAEWRLGWGRDIVIAIARR